MDGSPRFCADAHSTYSAPHGCGAGEIYGGTRQEVLFRCALLTKAALEAPLAVPCGDTPYGEKGIQGCPSHKRTWAGRHAGV